MAQLFIVITALVAVIHDCCVGAVLRGLATLYFK
jgi:hypothetical protein